MDLLFKDLPELPEGQNYALIASSKIKELGIEHHCINDGKNITYNENSLFTYEDLVEYTGFTYATLKKMHCNKEIHGTRINGYTGFTKETADYLRDRYSCRTEKRENIKPPSIPISRKNHLRSKKNTLIFAKLISTY